LKIGSTGFLGGADFGWIYLGSGLWRWMCAMSLRRLSSGDNGQGGHARGVSWQPERSDLADPGLWVRVSAIGVAARASAGSRARSCRGRMALGKSSNGSCWVVSVRWCSLVGTRYGSTCHEDTLRIPVADWNGWIEPGRLMRSVPRAARRADRTSPSCRQSSTWIRKHYAVDREPFPDWERVDT